MIRVLQVISSLEGSGGVQKRLVDNYRNMDHDKVYFDFVVHGYDSAELEPVVEQMGCDVFHVTPKKEGILKNIKDINKVIKNGKYDIVQSHMEHAGAIVLPISKRYGVRVRIAHCHLANIPASGFGRLYKSICSRIINKTATDFWACSRDAGKWLFEKDREDLHVIPNAIEVDKFQFDISKRIEQRAKLGLSEDEIAIVNVGRLSFQKNHMFLIDIARAIKDKGAAFKLYLVGDGELRDEITDKIKLTDVEDRVVLLGTRNDVSDVLQAMDVMVHPAFFEGLGNVLIEAQAAGLPVLAADEGIPKETNITSIIRYLSLKNDAESWADATLEMARIARKDLSKQVKDANFDVKTQGKNLENLYDRLVKERQK